MVTLLIGIVVFLGVHTLTTLREPRAALIARFGEGPYKGLYSLGALVGFVLILRYWPRRASRHRRKQGHPDEQAQPARGHQAEQWAEMMITRDEPRRSARVNFPANHPTCNYLRPVRLINSASSAVNTSDRIEFGIGGFLLRGAGGWPGDPVFPALRLVTCGRTVHKAVENGR